MRDACATYNAQRERNANAKRATKRKLDNTQAWQTQAHRNTRQSGSAARERETPTQRANLKCKVLDAKHSATTATCTMYLYSMNT